LFKRTRTSYQVGSLTLEERKRGPAVWVYRWWEKGTDGTPIRRKQQIGTLERYPTESAARAASDTLRLTINDQSRRQSLPRSVRDLWEHYCCEELPRNEITTQDTYTVYAKTWILPRWGNMCLEQVKTVEVERWLRMVERADGTKAKIKPSCRPFFRMRFAGSSVPTIRFHRESRWEREESGGRASGCESAPRDDRILWCCHQRKSNLA
jgi:integrase